MEGPGIINAGIEILLSASADLPILVLNLLHEAVHLLEFGIRAFLVTVYLILHTDAGGADGHSPHEIQVHSVDGGGGARKDISRRHIRVVRCRKLRFGPRKVRYVSSLSFNAVVDKVSRSGNTRMCDAAVVALF